MGDPDGDFRYEIYGLGIVSDRAIPGLVPCAESGRIDIAVRFRPGASPPEPEDAAWFVSAYRSDDGDPILNIWRIGEDEFFFSYRDGTRFLVRDEGRTIEAAWPDPLTVEDAASYLLGPVLGFVLRRRGTVCLHASGVNVNGRLVALLGQTGAGKSTAAAAFARMGFPVLSDDLVALSEGAGRFWAYPAYPRVRLWPPAVAALFDSADALPRMTPTWEKRVLDLTGEDFRFQAAPLPVGAVYVLGERRAHGAPSVGPLSTQATLLALVANTYGNFLLDAEMRGREFDVLGRMSAAVPVRNAVSSADLSRLPLLCDAILDDFTSLGAAPNHPAGVDDASR